MTTTAMPDDSKRVALAEQLGDALEPERAEHDARDRRDPAEDDGDDQAQRHVGPNVMPGCSRS